MPLQEQDHNLIEKHLLQQLSEHDQKAFEQRLSDPDFQKELDLQKDLSVAFKVEGRAQLKNQLKSFEKKIQQESVEKIVPVSRFRIGRVLAMAASIALLLIAFYWVSNQGPSGEQLFAQHFESYPNVVAPISKSIPGATDKAKAYQAYELKNYTEAIQLLSALPQNESTHFYIGLSKLSMDQAQEAITYFDKIQNKDNPFYVPANWYKALALIRQGKKGKAKTHLLIVTQNARTTGMVNKVGALLKDME